MDTQSHMHQWRQIIKGLGKRGAHFVEIKRGSKLPTRKGWNQLENTLTTEQALQHLANGYNISLASGTGNLYAFDFDRDAARGYDSIHLEGGIHTRRENAPTKAKFIFSCPDPIPTRLKSKAHGIDLLGLNSNGTHWSCIVAGIHNSGAPIVWGGHTIPELPAETVAAIWEEWTGEELFAPEGDDYQPDLTYVGADLGRVADALKHVDPNAMDYGTWIGIIAALHDSFGDDALELAAAWADGKRGEVEAKWHTFDREYTGRCATLDGIFYRARQNEWRDTWLQDRLIEYRRQLASPETIERLKEHFKNPERARKLLDTILQKCEDVQGLRVTPGYAYLSKGSTVGLGRMGDYLGRLFAAGFINLKLGQKSGDATTIELVLHNVNTYTPDGDTIHVVQNWNDYREQRDSEAFINNHYAYSSTRTKAELAPLGDNGLGALLALLDGPVSIREAAELVGYTYHAMARTLRRYAEHGMVEVTVGERNRKTFTLKQEWRAILAVNLPKMTTYGVQLVRHVDALKSRARLLDYKGEDEKAAKVGSQHARMAALLVKVKDEAGIVPYVHTGKNAVAERLDRLRDVQRAGERAESRPKHRSYKPKRPDVSIFAAGAEWGDFDVWAKMTYGSGWWIRRDTNGVLLAYEQYLEAHDFVPTIHWEGDPSMPQTAFAFGSVGA